MYFFVKFAKFLRTPFYRISPVAASELLKKYSKYFLTGHYSHLTL